MFLLALTTADRQWELDLCAARALLAPPGTARGASIRHGSGGHTDDIDE